MLELENYFVKLLKSYFKLLLFLMLGDERCTSYLVEEAS